MIGNMSEVTKAACIQFCSGVSPEANLDRLSGFVAQAAAQSGLQANKAAAPLRNQLITQTFAAGDVQRHTGTLVLLSELRSRQLHCLIRPRASEPDRALPD